MRAYCIVLLFLLLPCYAPRLKCQNAGSQVSDPDTHTDVSDTSTRRHPETLASAAPLPQAVQPVRFQSSVVVSGYEDSSAKPGGATTQYHATSKEIESSAGTYGDLSRYLQLFPGVVFNSDESDDVLVRGGNPIENLYLLDGIEVPNINHIATDATTGGLVSMIDSSAISNVEFLTGGYDASYEDRLSSVISIHSRELSGRQPYDAVDAGFIGAGFISERPFLDNGSILVTAHRSLLNLFTNNIGLSGVPIYTNALSRAEWNPTANDSLSIDSLTGIDSIRITPDRDDPFETNTIDTQYSGWRLTNGIRWRHMYSRDGFGVWTLSNSEQRLNIDQQDQLFDDTLSPGANRDDNPLVPVYSESTHDGMTNLRYDGYQRLASDLAFAFGASGHLYRIAYSVQQPYGEQSPLSTDPTRSDATSFFPHFWTAETGYYGQVTKTFRRWSLDAGGRFQQFSFGDHLTFTPRVGLSCQASERLAFHAGGAEYQQLPPFLELTSYSQNRALKPIKASHFTAGARWNPVRGMGVNLELYQKEYTAYPVSTEYPSLSLANMVDTLGQEFIWIPLVSMGKGYAQGIELSTEMRWADRLELQANAAMALDKFAGLDGIYRRGNFDYPFVLNLAGQTAISKRYAASWRYEYTAGRPYTPFAEAASVQQNRPVYDLNRMNALRGPFYSRLDFKASRMFLFGSRRLSLYGGLENAMDRNNFLGIAWTPRRGDVGLCQKSITYCISDQDQMGIFPDLGAMFVF